MGKVNWLNMQRARNLFRPALAFARSTEPRTLPGGRAIAVDAALAAAVALASVATAVDTARGQALVLLVPAKAMLNATAAHGAPGGIGAAAVLACVLTTAPLALRRVQPLTVFWVLLLGTIFTSQYANLVTFIAVVLAAYSAVVHSRFRGAAVIGVLLAGVVVTAAFPDTTPPLPGRFTALLVLAPVVLVGTAMHLWRQRAGDSQARLQRVQAEQEAATTRALAAERARIAAELHDVVTHNVSVMVVQAGAARRVMATSPAESTAALLAVEESGRTAMIELQHLLGLLSPGEGMQLQDAGLRPQPGLGQLRPLLDRVTTAGLPVDLTVTGQPGPLQPGTDLAAYRVVQEALTNVLKHTGQARTAVRLDYRPHELVIDVTDDGPQRAGEAYGRGLAPAAGPLSAPSAAGTAGLTTVPASGRGLLGLRERVSLYGGEFDAGPRPSGGWRVTARLPRDRRPDDDSGRSPAGDGMVMAPRART